MEMRIQPYVSYIHSERKKTNISEFGWTNIKGFTYEHALCVSVLLLAGYLRHGLCYNG